MLLLNVTENLYVTPYNGMYFGLMLHILERSFGQCLYCCCVTQFRDAFAVHLKHYCFQYVFACYILFYSPIYSLVLSNPMVDVDCTFLQGWKSIYSLVFTG